MPQNNHYHDVSIAYLGRASDNIDINTQFPLLQGSFLDCSVNWDGNKFAPSSKEQLYLCCLHKLSEGVEMCRNNCKDQECQNICDTYSKLVQDKCDTAIRFGGGLATEQNPFNKAVKRLGCWNKETNSPDKSCIEKLPKYSLVKECDKNCIPTMYTDCKNHCDIAYTLYTDRSKINDIFKKREKKNFYETTQNQSCKRSFSKLLIIFIVLVIIIIFLFVF